MDKKIRITKKLKNYIDFDYLLKKELKDPEFRRMFNEHGTRLELAYQILQMRKKKKMSQTVLAKKLKTKQSNVARMESGQQNFTTEMLVKIASVFDRELKIEFR